MLEEAYHLFKAAQSQSTTKAVEELALETVFSLHREVDKWSENEDINFVENYLLGPGPDAFAVPMAIPLPGIENNLRTLLLGYKHQRQVFRNDTV